MKKKKLVEIYEQKVKETESDIIDIKVKLNFLKYKLNILENQKKIFKSLLKKISKID